MVLMNMFSPFDPSSNLLFLMTLLSVLCFHLMTLTKMNWLWNKIINSMKKEFQPNLKSTNQNSSMKLFISLFIMIMVINLTGLLPSSFSFTSQMSLNFPLAMMVWMATNMYMMLKNKEDFISHLVPVGTPNPLSPFLVLVEMISNLIRPITLSVRLTANMIAGHILIALMETFVVKANPNAMITFLISSILMMLETGVSIIQAYVFSILVSLYYSE